MEKWAQITGYEGIYEVSNTGLVRRFGSVRKKKPEVTHNGYLRVSLHSHGTCKKHFVHRLVLNEFIGPRPKGTQACHNNGDKTDNKYTNLRWDSAKGNHADKILHGTMIRGSNHSNAKLSEANVEQIWRLRDRGCSLGSIAGRLGVSESTVSLVLRGKIWNHVKHSESRPMKKSGVLCQTDKERISDLRSCGVSQSEIAMWFGVSRSYIALIDRGLRL